MNKPVFFVVLLSFIFCISSVGLKAQTQTEIDKLIEEASIDTQKGAIFSYTYQMKVSFNRNKKWGFGRKFTRVYEAIVPSRFTLTKVYTHPMVLIQDSEKQLSDDSIMKARKDLVTELERAENSDDKQSGTNNNVSGGYWTMQLKSNELRAKVDIFQLLKAAQFSNLQHREIDGRKTITIDFAPKAGAKIERIMDYLTQLEGQIWIDEKTKRITRVEGFYLGTFNALRDKPDAERENQSILLFTQTRIGEDFWFPKIVRLDFTRYPDIFESVRLEFSFSGYKKATVDVKDMIKPPDQATDKTTTPAADEEPKAN